MIKRVRAAAVMSLIAVTSPPGPAAAQAPAPPPSSAAATAPSACKMALIAELKIDVSHNRMLTTGEINGRPVVVQIDTGAAVTLIFRSAAARLGLTAAGPAVASLYGVGGESDIVPTLVKSFTLAGASLHNVRLLVAGAHSSDVDLLLGSDYLANYDQEFDLAGHVLRLLKPQHCADNEMPYWATGPYSETPLVDDGGLDRHPHIQVRLNGVKINATLDSGAATSVATHAAAVLARVALKAGDDHGDQASGIGARLTSLQAATLDSFEIGDETIHHPRLMFGDLFRDARYDRIGTRIPIPVDGLDAMLLGADFFKAHRVLVSRTHRMVYFTYNGGPVFAVDQPPPRTPRARVPAAAAPEHTPG